MTPKILAIDTSCDDTSAAVTAGVTVLSNIISSQAELHAPYGGIFPTIAKQAHQENLDPTIKLALKRARASWDEITAIAVTQGPGLAPALETGLARAKQLAKQHNLPLIPINHLEAHALSPLAERRHRPPQPEIITWPEKLKATTFPALAIIVSGGHTEFIKCTQIGQYERLGFSIDDAAGEALDKVGRMLDLGYPAGPVMEKFAKKGDADKYSVPLPMTDREDFNMSFSGLKTWARNKLKAIEADSGLTQELTYDFTASFQRGVFRHICYKLNKLLKTEKLAIVWLGGGVAANIKLRRMLRETLKAYNLQLQVPFNKKLCMDNAAMIGLTAGYKLRYKLRYKLSHKLVTEQIAKNPQQLDRKPRWKLG